MILFIICMDTYTLPDWRIGNRQYLQLNYLHKVYILSTSTLLVNLPEEPESTQNEVDIDHEITLISSIKISGL